MNYTKEFQELVNICQPTYIGTGNPNSKVLLIGKECAIDPIDNRPLFLREIVENATNWEYNISQNTGSDQVDNWLSTSNPQYNPLYPYKGQFFKKMSGNQDGSVRGEGGTCATWYNYQKLLNLLLGVSDDYVSFHKYSFMTEMNEATGRYSRYISNNDRCKSIEKRCALLKNDFFQQFPIVIVACGHYLRDYNINLEDIFGVQWVGHTDDIGDNWMNIHYQTSGSPKLLIHTNQLSMNISNELLNNIADVCLKFMKENNITI